MDNFPVLTAHAAERAAQRGLSLERLNYVLQHGKYIHRTGVTFVSLRRRDIPPADRSRDAWAKLDGTIVLISPDSSIITAYRNRKGHHEILKKDKFRRRQMD